MLLADKLKELIRRGGDGTNVSAAARRLDVKPTTLADLVAGRSAQPSAATIGRIVSVYGVSAEWLLDEDAGFDDPRAPVFNGQGLGRGADEALVAAHLDELDTELRRGIGPELRHRSLLRYAIQRARQNDYSREGLFMVLDWAASQVATLEGRIEELRRQVDGQDPPGGAGGVP